MDQPASKITAIHLAMARVGSPVGDRALREWSAEDERNSIKRADSLLCRALLRGVLAGSTRLAASRWHIGKAEGGRPVATESGGGVAPAVSISHSGGWSACAVSFAGNVGIDIERMRCDRDISGIAARAFGPREYAEVAAEGCLRFYAIWTLREAIAKALGTGLATVADGRDRVAGGTCAEFRQISVDQEPWQVLHRTLHSDISLAVALRGSVQRPALQWWFDE